MISTVDALLDLAPQTTALVHALLDRNTWTGMLVTDPGKYLRIALTVEFSLARGDYPSKENFPPHYESATNARIRRRGLCVGTR